jgi:hypothetical protein
MPTVQGRLVKPSGAAADVGRTRARFRLVDINGRPVLQAWDTSADRVIVDYEDLDIDAEGDYSIDLPPNTQIEPSGTRWSRTVVLRGIEGPTRSLIVPVGGGPYDEHEILEEEAGALPEAPASAVIDSAEINTATGNLAVNAFALTPVPNLVVTVPDIDEPVLVRARGPVKNTPSRSQATVGTTNGQPGITGPANAFSAADEGRTITGTGIPASTLIVAVTSETAAVMSNNATGTASITATITGGLSTAALGIAAEATPSIGEQLEMGWVQLTSSSGVATAICDLHLPPNSPGDYYVMAYSLETGNVVVDASGTQAARIQAIRYGAV